MIILYIVEENIFVVTIYKLLVQKKYGKVILKTVLKLMSNKEIIMPKKGEYVKFKNYKRKIKSPFIIYADYESILIPKNNGKQNPREFYKNKYQKHIAFSYGYKLVCIDEKFSKPFQTYFRKDAVYNFVNSLIKESKYCSDLMKKQAKNL